MQRSVASYQVIHDKHVHTVHSCILYMCNGHYENELSDSFYGVCSTPIALDPIRQPSSMTSLFCDLGSADR